MLGMTLVTKQTGPQGRVVKRLYVEEGCDIARELYLGAVVDRGSGRIAIMASTEGGVEIEEVAAEAPEKIVTVRVDPAAGFQPFLGRRIAFGLGLQGEQIGKAVKFRSEEHTSELQSLMRNSYAVFCLKKKKQKTKQNKT